MLEMAPIVVLVLVVLAIPGLQTAAVQAAVDGAAKLRAATMRGDQGLVKELLAAGPLQCDSGVGGTIRGNRCVC
eukprot:COSAG02_NODE_38562_length_427_cov_1.423780_1_plen_73_part_10